MFFMVNYGYFSLNYLFYPFLSGALIQVNGVEKNASWPEVTQSLHP